jgi:RNA polymerase sigma factor (sigma-70 family)
VVQDTFLKLCSAPREKVQGHLAAWLFTVCRNRARDVRRKENRMGTVEPKELESRESPTPSPSAELEKRESLSRILEALASLPENQREVLRLKFQNDLSYREISEITALSVSNVGFLIHTGLRALRERLREEPVGSRRTR